MSNQTEVSSLQSESTELRREITLFGGISILAGIMVGSGIFYLGSYVLIRSGMSMGMALLVWIIGGVITLFSGLCYAELGTMMPKAGGQYVYLREAFGERIAYMSGISAFVLGSSGSIAGLAVAFPSALSSVVAIPEPMHKYIAIGLVIFLSAINFMGVKFGSTIQNIFMVAKIIPIALIMICGLLMGGQSPDLSLSVVSTMSFPQLCSMVAFAVVATLWAYEGWTNLNTISEEIKNPKKNIPMAIIISCLFVTVLYTIFNYAIYRTVPLETIEQLFAQGDYFLGTEAAKILFGDTGKLIVGIGMAVAVFGALNGCVMVFPRTYYAMARDGLFFRSFTKIHPKYKTPTGAIVASAIVSTLLVCSRDLNQLTSLVAFSGFIFNSLTFYSVIVLRKKYPNLSRPYKVIFYPVTVILMILVNIGLLLNTLKEDPVTSIIGLAVPLSGLVIYELITRLGKKSVQA